MTEKHEEQVISFRTRCWVLLKSQGAHIVLFLIVNVVFGALGFLVPIAIEYATTLSFVPALQKQLNRVVAEIDRLTRRYKTLSVAIMDNVLPVMRAKGMSADDIRTIMVDNPSRLPDPGMVEEMRELERRLPAFAFVPAVRAPDEGAAWDGERGLVTEVLGRRIESAAEMEAYLCGPPPMIDAAMRILPRLGITAEHIYFDKF